MILIYLIQLPLGKINLYNYYYILTAFIAVGIIVLIFICMDLLILLIYLFYQTTCYSAGHESVHRPHIRRNSWLKS